MAGAYWAAAEPSRLVAQLLAARAGQKAWTLTEVAWASMAAAMLTRPWKQAERLLIAVQLEAQANATAGPMQQRQRAPGGADACERLLCVMLPAWCCEVLPPSCSC